jgi:NAD(P)H-hydrate epimerase
LVLLDGLVGLGASGPLRPELSLLSREMNALRSNAWVVAMDIPSGLDPDSGAVGDDTVRADWTATIAIGKKGLVADGATGHVGRLAVIPVQSLGDIRIEDEAELLTPALLRPLLPRRAFDMYKGQAGRVSILAGSPEKPGAAALSVLGALNGGAGLVTFFGKPEVLAAVRPLLPPDVMLRQITDYGEALPGADAVVIGPGLGSSHDKEVREVIYHATQPLVIDADALNVLARFGTRELRNGKGPRLLTPHPGEMARLDPPVRGTTPERRKQAETFVTALPNVTMLLKGSRSVIATAGRPTRLNTTGHPAMAAGGMGDVLSGLTAALAAQGCSLHDAAALGSWLLGRAAEVALASGQVSPESLTASLLAGHLGAAFTALRESRF